MESKERIRGIHVNTAGGSYAIIVGEDSVYSGRDEPTTVLTIDKVMGVGPEGAMNVYRVFSASPSGEIKERIDIPSVFVPFVIWKEVK